MREMLAIGSSVTDFVQAVDELYKEESEARNILDRGKPAIFCQDREARYLFVRPDLIFTHLQEVVLPTWVVGEEQHFVLGVPDLTSLPRSRRAWALKKSGFGPYSSWSEGVDFLHKKSKANTKAMLERVYLEEDFLWVVQQFRTSRYFEVCYEDRQEGLVPMRAKFRITPYFSMVRGNEGRLLAVKATGREKTDYLHTTTDSVNMAVAQR